MIPGFQFLTTFVLITIIFPPFFSKFLDIPLLALFVFVMGSYISFVEPGYYVFNFGKKQYKLEGICRFLTVDIIHIIILIASFAYFSLFPRINNILLSLSVIVLYITIFDINKVYHIKETFVALSLSCFIILLYLLVLVSFKHETR